MPHPLVKPDVRQCQHERQDAEQKDTNGGAANQTYDFGFTPSGFNGGNLITLTTTGVNGSQVSTVFGGLAPGVYSVRIGATARRLVVE